MAMRFELMNFFRLTGSPPNQVEAPLNQTGVSESLLVAEYTGKTVVIGGTFVGTAQLEGSLDGTTWIVIGASTTTPAVRETTASWRFLRINVTAYTSGEIVAMFSGYNTRVAH